MKTKEIFKLILADDHILLRDALAKLIDAFEEFQVIMVAGNGNEVKQFFEKGNNADIILMDLNMPETDGYETAKWLAKNRPEIKILILTMYQSDIALIRLLQAGIHGYLKKDIHPNELKEALLTVAGGDYFYSGHSHEKLVSHFLKNFINRHYFEKATFTNEEIEFIKLAATEITYKDIAQTMKLSPRQIDNFRDNLFFKLKVKTRVGLTIFAIKNGIVSF
jgi:DNA-binding NarL/FixJ family response regulator